MSNDILSAAQNFDPDKDTPLSLSKATSSSIGRQTSWKSQRGMALGKKNFGSTLNWDDTPGVTPPSSDKGASFGGA
jgi:hypothetical protein